ncbi:3-oxoacyl-[acyl-carrier-protein] synthase, partial [Tulasnella sp. 425]
MVATSEFDDIASGKKGRDEATLAGSSNRTSDHDRRPAEKTTARSKIRPPNPCIIGGSTVYGMWSSAATRKYVENVAAEGRAERVASYDVTFVGMVLPCDRLEVKLKHIGMNNGKKAILVETSIQRGEKVLVGTAEVAQAPTVYVFTGQGSQEPGMGMELCSSSPAARAVWEAADKHLTAVYEFSIVDI